MERIESINFLEKVMLSRLFESLIKSINVDEFNMMLVVKISLSIYKLKFLIMFYCEKMYLRKLCE